jgi:hypothetical protein
MNDINPSMRLGEDGINSVLVALEAIRERALSTYMFSAGFPQLTLAFSLSNVYICTSLPAE